MATANPKKAGAANLRWWMLNTLMDRGAAEAELSIIALATWCAMFRHAGGDGRVTISVGRLARSTGMSESSIKKAIAEMKAKRLLKLLNRGGTDSPAAGSKKRASTFAMAPYPMPLPSRGGEGDGAAGTT